MASGPTQNYDDPTLVAWQPHPALARVVRVVLALLPVAVALVVGILAVRLAPPERVGLDPWLWLVLEVALTALLLVGVGRLTRRLLPLVTLLRLTLVLPDRVPSRLAGLRRASPPEVLHARVERAGADDADGDAAVLLELVSALARHDRATFRHSERVRGYATLIGRELGVGAADTARLGWAALLHDVGKVTVPTEVLNKTARLDADEWATVTGHAAAGGSLAAPLSRWLGPWAGAIDEHHERWDGGGYPRGLAGEQISLGARIVAVADAFDVITSTRAYKTALPPDAARAELARCAGAQFDPAVVRAFLAVGLGELRRVAGPLALLGAAPALPVLQRGASATLGRAAGTGPVATSAGNVAAAMVVGAGLAVASPVLSAPPAAQATSDARSDGQDADEALTDGASGDTAVLPVVEAPADAGGPVQGDGTTDEPDEPAGDGATDAPDDPSATPAPETPAPPDDPTSDDDLAPPDDPTPDDDGAPRPGPALPPQASDPAREAVDGPVGSDATPGQAGRTPSGTD